MRYKLLIGQKRTYIYKWGKIKYILKSNINNIFLRISGRGDIWVKFLRKNISFFFFLNELYFLFYLFFIFLFFKFIYFNWRLITLQYSIGFAIHWHEFAMAVHVFPILKPPLPPPSPSHPSGSSQCTSPEHPVSCIKPGLAIHFICDYIHVSMPFSQIIPPSPSPTESKRLFYTSVSIVVSHAGLSLPSF